MADTQPYDLIIRGGNVVDGTGLPRRRVDVGIRAGRIEKLAQLDGAVALEEIDASGAIVAPGIVDVHTHYDPQITFDPYATMSCYHGVTTVVAGNCGFSVAPCRRGDTQFIKDIFANIEDMDPVALSGVRWDDFETFPQFLASLRGNLGINFACYVGHSNLRRWVMGDDCYTRAATLAEVEQMVAMLGDAMEAGAAGLSSSASPIHFDVNGRPNPSRLSGEAELAALVVEVGRHRSASIGYLPRSNVAGFDAEDRELVLRLALKGGVPIIIQGVDRTKPDGEESGWETNRRFFARADSLGAPVYSMMHTRPFDRSITLDADNKHYRAVASWDELFALPVEQRRERLRDPRSRETLRYDVEHPNPDFQAPPPWWSVFLVQAALEKNKSLEGKSIAAIAEQRGTVPADVFLDLILEEDFATVLRMRLETPSWGESVRAGLHVANVIPGTSDGGAHIAKDDGSDWSLNFLRRWVIDGEEWTLEEGVRQLTQIPAAIVGLHDRGTLHVGGWADVMIFDPLTVGPKRKEFVRDLPGNVGRWRSWGEGIKATIVNGQPIVLDGRLTGRLPGQVVSPL